MPAPDAPERPWRVLDLSLPGEWEALSILSPVEGEEGEMKTSGSLFHGEGVAKTGQKLHEDRNITDLGRSRRRLESS